MSDWKSGALLGSGYAFVADGKVAYTAADKATLREMWKRAAALHGDAPCPEHLIKQVCFVLPPWEKL